jgi:hypothetical protein
MELSLSREEAAFLHRVLTNYLPGLREEIAGTENYEWRQALKKDEELLKALIERLEKAGVTSS